MRQYHTQNFQMQLVWRVFNSKRELREHIDKNHRITDSKVAAAERTIKGVTLSSSIKNSKLDAEE